MFPELLRLWKEFRSDSGAPISLDLKSVTFDPVSVGEAQFYRKYPQIIEALGGMPGWSGEAVSVDTALGHSVLFASYRLVTETMGVLPFSLKIERDGVKVDAVDHPMYSAMHDEPNAEMSAQTFKEVLTGHCMFGSHGSGFAKIVRRSGTAVAISLKPLMPSQVVIDREKTRQKRLVYNILNEQGATDKSYTVEAGKPHDILHLRGLSWNGAGALDVLRVGRNSIGTAIAGERFAASFWARGGRKPYAIEAAQRFESKKKADEYRADLEEMMRDFHKPPIFDNGKKLIEMGMTMLEAQALESRQWTVSELSRWSGISPHLLQDLSHATFSNIEQQFLEFKTITAARWAKRWEQDFRRCVMTPEEKAKGYFLKVNLNAFMVADFKTRMEGYASALQNGWKNIDEVRDLEDDNPLPNGAGKTHVRQLNMGTVPGTGGPTITEQGILARIKPAPQSTSQGETQ